MTAPRGPVQQPYEQQPYEQQPYEQQPYQRPVHAQPPIQRQPYEQQPYQWQHGEQQAYERQQYPQQAHRQQHYPQQPYRQSAQQPAYEQQLPYEHPMSQVQSRSRRHRRDDPPPPTPRRPRFSALAWTALILGVVGVVGSPIIILNNLTAVVAGVGVVLGVIALFGTRKILALIGVVVCVGAIVFTVLAQGAAVAAFDRQFGGLGAGADPAVLQDVSVRDCAVIDRGYGLVTTEGTIEITNSAAEPQTYSVTVSVNDGAGVRVGEINAFVNALAPGQSAILSGTDATGTASEQAAPGPAACVVADVSRFGG